MRYIVLARHSLPDVVPSVAGNRWRLSVEGRARCQVMAERLLAYRPALIVASTEPKAAETASLLAAHLQIPCKTGEELHEHEREGVAYMGETEWEQTMMSFFARPDELVFGSETAAQALQRFTTAIQRALDEHVEENIIVVTHGTVMALFVAYHARVQPFPFWCSLGTPGFTGLSLPTYSLVETVTWLDMTPS